jgi:hypothetical protein
MVSCCKSLMCKIIYIKNKLYFFKNNNKKSDDIIISDIEISSDITITTDSICTDKSLHVTVYDSSSNDNSIIKIISESISYSDNEIIDEWYSVDDRINSSYDTDEEYINIDCNDCSI